MATPTPASLPRLLLLLSATTGLVDAASVLGLGKVFTANMTGNIVFLGFAAAGAPGFKVAPSLLALFAFMLGAANGGQLARRYIERPLRRWLLVVAVLEATLLCLAALLSLFIEPSPGDITPDLLVVIALTGFAMGLRNATVRQLKVPDLTTTVLTLTITGIAADRPAPGKGSPLPRRIGAVLTILLGAILGAALLLHVGLYAPLALAGMLALAATLLFARDPASALPHRT